MFVSEYNMGICESFEAILLLKLLNNYNQSCYVMSPVTNQGLRDATYAAAIEAVVCRAGWF